MGAKPSHTSYAVVSAGIPVRDRRPVWPVSVNHLTLRSPELYYDRCDNSGRSTHTHAEAKATHDICGSDGRRRFFSAASRPLNQLFIARLRSAPKQQFMISGILLPIARNASRWV